MNTNERVILIRKALNLTQEEFGKKIGVVRSSVSGHESGRRNLSEQTIKAICREFNVDYIWLTTGEGEMFTNIPETILDELVIEHNLDEMDKNLISEYLKLDEESRNVLKNYIKHVLIK
ncbi:hypothetical protein JCM1393_25050 [Clostridium carnis]